MPEPPTVNEWLPINNGSGGLEGEPLKRALLAHGFVKGDTIEYTRKGSDSEQVRRFTWDGSTYLDGNHVSICRVRRVCLQPSSSTPQTKQEAQALVQTLPSGTPVTFECYGHFPGSRTGTIKYYQGTRGEKCVVEDSNRWTCGVSRLTVLPPSTSTDGFEGKAVIGYNACANLLNSLPEGTQVLFTNNYTHRTETLGTVKTKNGTKYVVDAKEASWKGSLATLRVANHSLSTVEPAASTCTPAATQGPSPMRHVIQSVVGSKPAPTEKNPNATEEVTLQGPDLLSISDNGPDPTVQQWIFDNTAKITAAGVILGSIKILRSEPGTSVLSK